VMNVSLEDKTTLHRIANWEMALKGVKERPILGWGQEAYQPVFSKYYDIEKLYDAEQWFDRTHNTFLDWLVFGGIIGFVSYLLLFIIILLVLWKKTSITPLQKSILTGLFAGYLFQNMVAFDSLVSGIFLYASFAFVVILSQKENIVGKAMPGKTLIKIIGMIFLICLTVMWMNYSIFQPKAASKNFIKYIVATSQTNTPDTVAKNYSLLEKSFSPATFFSKELAEQIVQRRATYLVQGVDPDVLRDYFDLITVETERVLVLYNFPTKLMMAQGAFLIEIGAPQQAELYLKKAIEQSPDKANAHWLLANSYERQGKIDQADALLKRVTELVPQYEIGQEIYRQFLERHGRG